MKHRIVFIHGWAMTPALWSPMVQSQWEDAVFLSPNSALNFFSREQLHSTHPPTVWVGHSLGFLVACGLAQANDLLIAFNGFTCFSQKADFPQGVPPRLLHLMNKKLLTDSSLVVSEFLSRCLQNNRNTIAVPSRPDFSDLEQGLDALLTLDMRGKFLQERAWAMASTKDDIASAALTLACFSQLPKERLLWVDGGSHLLPLTHASLCRNFLRKAIE